MSVRVVARIRPLLAKELEKDIIVHADSSEEGRAPNVVRIPSPKNEAEEFTFAFNGVYDQTTSQEALFNAEVAPHIKSLFQGLDVTLFAYGVTGTGKTHTMRGGMKLADRGVIPRLLSHVFRRGKKIAKDSGGRTTAEVALSYYEIYNDKVYDLLEPPEKRTAAGLPLREKDSKTFVVGLSEQACADLKDFERLYIAANQNRVTASTKLNAHSSRSHAILRVKLTQTAWSDSGDVLSVKESTASAIDLAGSEDNRRTDNDRTRLVESAAINKSLFVLSQCVDAIARGEKRIPYRESKMTRILSLGQNHGITVMILNLAPVRSYHLDTLSSLNVSSRAKRIEVREIENEVVFKMPPRSLSHLTSLASSASSSSTSLTSLSSGGSLARQPLRALTNNAHNIQSGMAATKAAADKPDKPVKAFSVYTDRVPAKPVVPTPAAGRMAPLANMSQPRRSNSGHSSKRPSDSAEARPSKLARPSVHTHLRAHASAAAPAAAAPQLSAAQIEAIIERKVAEALAARAQEEATTKHESEDETQAASDAVQKRLEALERRIDDSARSDDPRAEGLRCLLLARQHKEVGDDAAALRYYEQALPFFPGQAKLLGKIEKLQAKMARDGAKATPRKSSARMASPRKTVVRMASPRKASPRKLVKRKRMVVAAAAESDAGEVSTYREAEDSDADADVEAEADDSFVDRPTQAKRAKADRRRQAAKLSRRPKTPQAVIGQSDSLPSDADDDADDEEVMTPRKRQLLDIVNSRDIGRIRGLAGVGAKKARDLVDYLERDEHDDESIASLAQLRSVPGMGGRTVERAYEGLA